MKLLNFHFSNNFMKTAVYTEPINNRAYNVLKVFLKIKCFLYVYISIFKYLMGLIIKRNAYIILYNKSIGILNVFLLNTRICI